MKILTIGASSSSKSINRQFAEFAASRLPGAEVVKFDLSQEDAPLYSVDTEEKQGIPGAAIKLIRLIEEADGIIISLAEHNGSYTAAFKSLFDWATRKKQKVWSEKAMLLLSTSPGARGGATVFELAKNTFPRMGARLIASFSLPSFYDNFSSQEGITNSGLNEQFEAELKKFRSSF